MQAQFPPLQPGVQLPDLNKDLIGSRNAAAPTGNKDNHLPPNMQNDEKNWHVCKTIASNLCPIIAKVVILAVMGLIALWWAPSIAPVFFVNAGALVITHLVIKFVDQYNSGLLDCPKDAAWKVHQKSSLITWVALASIALICLASLTAGIALAVILGVFDGFIHVRLTARMNQTVESL